MSKKNILLIGAGGHALSSIDVIEQDGKFKIAGLIGFESELGKNIQGYNVIATDRDLEKLKKEYEFAFVVIGQLSNGNLRRKIYTNLLKIGFKLPSIVSPYAYVSPTSRIGNGTLVSHGAIVNACVRIGENCIINSKALIEHGCVILDHCHIATGTIVNGDTLIKTGSFIGSGAILKQSITIETNSRIKMGEIVKKSNHDY